MNPLEQVNKCQNYIMFIQLHQDRSKITSQRKTSQTGRISELEGEKLGKKSICVALISICAAVLCCLFWGTFWSENWAQVGFLESHACLLSKPSGIFQFGVHFPLQKWGLQTLLPVWPKRGRKGIFEVFLTLLEAQNLTKFLCHLWEFIFLHEESKNAEFSSKRVP